VFYVICHECVSALKLGRSAGKEYDVLVGSEQAMHESRRKTYQVTIPKHRRSAGARCSDTGGGA